MSGAGILNPDPRDTHDWTNYATGAVGTPSHCRRCGNNYTSAASERPCPCPAQPTAVPHETHDWAPVSWSASPGVPAGWGMQCKSCCNALTSPRAAQPCPRNVSQDPAGPTPDAPAAPPPAGGRGTFTPGPWDAQRGSVVGYAFTIAAKPMVPSDGWAVVADVCLRTNAAANAALIATAPELLAVASDMLPRNLCLTNANIPDETIVPLEVTMGELRKIAAVIAKANGA